VLGVSRDANEDEVKKAYKKMALKYHPDRHMGGSEAEKTKTEEKSKEISEAYNAIIKGEGGGFNPGGFQQGGFQQGGFQQSGFQQGGFQQVDPEELFRHMFREESMFRRGQQHVNIDPEFVRGFEELFKRAHQSNSSSKFRGKVPVSVSTQRSTILDSQGRPTMRTTTRTRFSDGTDEVSVEDQSTDNTFFRGAQQPGDDELNRKIREANRENAKSIGKFIGKIVLLSIAAGIVNSVRRMYRGITQKVKSLFVSKK